MDLAGDRDRNRQLPGVEFYLDRFFSSEQIATPDILEFRAFLRALTLPPKRVGKPSYSAGRWVTSLHKA